MSALGREQTKPLPTQGAASGDKVDAYHGGHTGHLRHESILKKRMYEASLRTRPAYFMAEEGRAGERVAQVRHPPP